jgi:hypothetical protein
VAALDALSSAGYEADVGPFGTMVEGESAELLSTMSTATIAAIDAGASGLRFSVLAVPTLPDGAQEFLTAIQPMARVLGARIVDPPSLSPSDIPLKWRGMVVGGLHRERPISEQNGIGKLVLDVERELGARLADLPRVDKQRAVWLLDERGAFAFRNAVDEIADALGVSRVTVYNYLNATRSRNEPAPRR